VMEKRQVENSMNKPVDRELQRLLQEALVQVKCAGGKNQGKVGTVNQAGSQEAEPQLQPSKARGNRSGERKRARGPHLQEGHNNSSLIYRSGLGAKFRGRFCRVVAFVSNAGEGDAGDWHKRLYNSSAICTAFNAAPLSN